ncbi:MAG: tetratricopeptide repeat protein [Candidatus Aminicenantes bacterium]|nr:tetratricopeptide repeat protein [Candidatus Aminicenantes bacterium]
MASVVPSFWHFVTFRYIAYFVAWIISLIRRVLANRFVKFIIIFLLVGVVQQARLFLMRLKTEADWFDLEEILGLRFLITTLALTLLIYCLTWIFKARKSIVISEFNNYTGLEELDKPVGAIPYRLISEIIRLKNLYKTIGELKPKTKHNLIIEATVSILDIGKSLEEAVGTNLEIQFGSKMKFGFNPLKLFGWLVRGPKLCGCLQWEGDKMVLIAWIRGGNLNGTWRMHSDDIDNTGEKEELPKFITARIPGLIDEITHHIFADLAEVGSPRWQAVKHYSNGLWQYRETVRTKENRCLTLRKAKTEFKKALAQDTEFAQCYYNLGIIYKKLGNDRAAEAAFRKALEKNPDNYKSYYKLSLIYQERKDYKNSRWFCEQAIQLQPSNALAWNLLAVIHYKKWLNDKKDHYKYQGGLPIPKEIIETAMVAVMLSWRELCRARAKNNVTPKHKDIATISIRNLSVLKGMKRPFKRWFSPFNQALFLSPENDDLHFELGKYYYRWEKWRKARDAFFRVYEEGVDIDEPLRYWSCYADANAHLYEKKIEEPFKETIEEGFTHFLDAAADILHNKRKDMERDIEPSRLDVNIETMKSALTRIWKYEKKIKEKTEKIEIHKREIEFAADLKEILNEVIEIHSDDKKNFYENKNKDIPVCLDWARSQLNVAVGKRLLELSELEKHAANSTYSPVGQKYLRQAIQLLDEAKQKLEKNYPRQITKLRLHMYLAQGYLRLEQLDKALFHAREAVRLNPFEPEERRLLGKVHIALENYKKAITELEISFRLEPDNHEILKELGEAYKRKGENACSSTETKKAYNSARETFSQALEIIGSHSFPDQEPGENDDKYIENLGLTHYYLGYFCYELLEYDAAATHSRAAAQMGYKPVSALIQAGWNYINAGAFYRAKQAFDKAAEYEKNTQHNNSLHSIEIKLGQAAAFLEGAVSIGDKKQKEYKEVVKWLETAGKGLKNEQKKLESAKRKLNIESIALKELKKKNDQDEKKKIHNEKEKKEIDIIKKLKTEIDQYLDCLPRLWFNYHECRGLMSFKEEKYEDALREFEQAVTYMDNARIYLRMAKTYRLYAAGNDNPDRRSHILDARNACDLCRKHDQREKHKEEIKSLLQELDTLEE